MSYADLIKGIEALKGFKLNLDLEMLKITHDIFSSNYIHFCYVIDMFEQKV